MLCVLFPVFMSIVLSYRIQEVASFNEECMNPLGMEDGTIKDHQITALTWLYFDKTITRYYRPYFGRLHNKHGGGGWCSEEYRKYPGQLLEIDLKEDTKLTKIATQGRYNGGEFVERFRLEYRRNNDSNFRMYTENGIWRIFDGNNDTDSVADHYLAHPMIARVVRLYPLGNLFTIYCLRLELYGCKWTKGKDGLVSYTAPLGDSRKDINLKDDEHDGNINRILDSVSNGIGKLTDDEYGSRSVRGATFSPWVGYQHHPTVLKFFFEKPRLFRAITLHVNTKKKDVRLFSEVNIEIVEHATKYTHVKRYVPSLREVSRSDAFKVRIILNGVVGRGLRLIFSHHSSWLLLSEVDFETVHPGRLNRSRNEVFHPTPKDGPNSVPNREWVTKKTTKEGKTKWKGSKEIGKSNSVTKAKKLSFPIVVTIVLVGAVVIAVIVTLVIRLFKKTKFTKQPVKYCHEYVTSANSVRLKPTINLYKFDGNTPGSGSGSGSGSGCGSVTRGLGPSSVASHKRGAERRTNSDFHRGGLRDRDALSSSQTSELYRTSSPASEFCRHLNGKPSDCSCNCKDCGATLSSSSRSPSELYRDRDDVVSLHSQTVVRFQGGNHSPVTECAKT